MLSIEILGNFLPVGKNLRVGAINFLPAEKEGHDARRRGGQNGRSPGMPLRLAQNQPRSPFHVIESHEIRRATLARRQPAGRKGPARPGGEHGKWIYDASTRLCFGRFGNSQFLMVRPSHEFSPGPLRALDY